MIVVQPISACPVAAQHIEYFNMMLAPHLNGLHIIRTVPFEGIDVVCRVQSPTVDGVAQIDGGIVSGRDIGDRLGEAGPCEKRTRDGAANDPHTSNCHSSLVLRRAGAGKIRCNSQGTGKRLEDVQR